tara:strand:- start:469 stop:756 length:288 start_codon:yes stop_codon:yes gene_type:complete
VNTIKRYKLLLVITFLITFKSHALSPKIEKELYIGCYSNSKAYIGADGAKIYCSCTVKKLSNKFTDNQINQIFKMKPEEIMKATEFATIECEKNK